MTRKEMNLRVFRGESLPRVFFQPRFEPWVDWHRQFGTLPEEIADLGLRDIYDRIGASMRTIQYYSGNPEPIVWEYEKEVVIRLEEGEDNTRIRYFDTPHGVLRRVEEYSVDRVWRTVEYPAKGGSDLKALRWLLERRHPHFSETNFRIGAEWMGDRGVPQFWVPKSPYLALAQQLMSFDGFIYAMADAPDEMEAIMRVIDDRYDPLYEQLTGCGLLEILNYGENIAMAYLNTRYFERYLLPFYEKRVGQLRRAGIFTHIHIDGYFKPLLPYLKRFPQDGLEALTPLPQGDVTLEEIRDHIGDKVLLDGIPAVYFLEHHSREALQACCEKLVEYFHPRLVLGISDELPEGTAEEGWERLKWVGDFAGNAGSWSMKE